ncbi:LysR family transcriptional regulator [Roseobacter weihaiensis]|uniref:LysR family transcriptional regulator n=1 Tax=Roseobacter weihaiensis TaxID=2763262 RepID=UPI001D0A0B18|nr:LysR family transcriptional regulator [Roseobacter sp. H9]
MDMRNLEAFCILASTLNFRRAAEKLRMSQPNLSGRIARLEDELGMRLFDRSRAGVKLLETGQQFLPHAQGLLERSRLAHDAAKAIASGLTGRLRVGYTPVSFMGEIPQILCAYSSAFPDVRLELIEGLSGDVETGLANGRLDAGFLHPPIADPRLSTSKLASHQYGIVLPSGHNLAKNERLSVAALAEEEFVLVERPTGPVIYDRLIAMCTKAGFAPRIRQEVGNSIAVLGLVAAGHGVGFVIDAMQTLGRKDVAFVAISDQCPTLDTCIAFDPNQTSPALEKFITFVVSNSSHSLRSV